MLRRARTSFSPPLSLLLPLGRQGDIPRCYPPLQVQVTLPGTSLSPLGKSRILLFSATAVLIIPNCAFPVTDSISVTPSSFFFPIRPYSVSLVPVASAKQSQGFFFRSEGCILSPSYPSTRLGMLSSGTTERRRSPPSGMLSFQGTSALSFFFDLLSFSLPRVHLEAFLPPDFCLPAFDRKRLFCFYEPKADPRPSRPSRYFNFFSSPKYTPMPPSSHLRQNLLLPFSPPCTALKGSQPLGPPFSLFTQDPPPFSPFWLCLYFPDFFIDRAPPFIRPRVEIFCRTLALFPCPLKHGARPDSRPPSAQDSSCSVSGLRIFLQLPVSHPRIPFIFWLLPPLLGTSHGTIPPPLRESNSLLVSGFSVLSVGLLFSV